MEPNKNFDFDNESNNHYYNLRSHVEYFQQYANNAPSTHEAAIAYFEKLAGDSKIDKISEDH